MEPDVAVILVALGVHGVPEPAVVGQPGHAGGPGVRDAIGQQFAGVDAASRAARCSRCRPRSGRRRRTNHRATGGTSRWPRRHRRPWWPGRPAPEPEPKRRPRSAAPRRTDRRRPHARARTAARRQPKGREWWATPRARKGARATHSMWGGHRAPVVFSNCERQPTRRPRGTLRPPATDRDRAP